MFYVMMQYFTSQSFVAVLTKDHVGHFLSDCLLSNISLKGLMQVSVISNMHLRLDITGKAAWPSQ